jgi:hypothetical protein
VQLFLLPMFHTDLIRTVLQKILVPTVTLTGQGATGQTVNTTLSNDQATFVSGVFAAAVTPTKSRVQPPIQTLVVASGSPFVVPGLNILIFPIGANSENNIEDEQHEPTRLTWHEFRSIEHQHFFFVTT